MYFFEVSKETRQLNRDNYKKYSNIALSRLEEKKRNSSNEDDIVIAEKQYNDDIHFIKHTCFRNDCCPSYSKYVYLERYFYPEENIFY